MMDYYSGTAADMTALRDAILSCASSSGFTVVSASTSTINRAGFPLTLELTLTTGGSVPKIVIDGFRGAAKCPTGFKLFQPSHATNVHYDWPIFWECYVSQSPQIEFYFIIRFQTDYYHTFCFGNSPVPEVSECGWFCASYWGGANETVANVSTGIINPSLENTFAPAQNICYGMFIGPVGFFNALDGVWVNTAPNYIGNAVTQWRGMSHISPVIFASPSPFSNAPILIPVRIMANRTTSNQFSLIGFVDNLRLIRLDNHMPGDVITFGAETWRVFPLYRRDANHPRDTTIGNQTHSGTFGFALRTS